MIVPSLSEAFALIVMLAGDVNVAPFDGEVIETEGGTFGVDVVTVTLLKDDVASVPFTWDVMARPT